MSRDGFGLTISAPASQVRGDHSTPTCEAAIYTKLAYSFDPPIAKITLVNPGNSNQPDLAMAADLRLVAEQISENGAQVVVVTGAGSVFSVGRPDLSGAQAADVRQWLEMHRCASVIADITIPVIAAINGDALDQGLELALACDFRIASQGARLGITDLARGVVPWDGGTQRLSRLIGGASALEMLLTGRILDAQEALGHGLVNRVARPEELDAQVQLLAATMTTKAPIALRYAKEAVMKGAELPIDQGLRLEADLNILLQSTKDRAEGISSFLEKRGPRFAGQ